MKKAERGVLVGIVVAIALALRWGYVASSTVQNPLRADAGQYAQYAKNLVEHGVYSLSTAAPPAPDSFRSPGYPLFLALCREIAGERWLALALVLQVALGAATVWLVYRVARQHFSFAPSLAAAVGAALSPHLVVPCGYVLTECVTTFLVVLASSQLRATKRSPWRAAVSGLLPGIVALCNETYVVLVPVLAWLVLRHHGKGRGLAYLVAGLLPLLAWNVRNQSTELARTGGDRVTASISHGSYPGMVFRDPRLFGFPYREDPAQPAFGASWQGLMTVLGERAAAEPWRYASWYLLEKPVWLWRWDLVQGRDVQVYEVANSPYETQPVVAGTHWLMRMLHLPIMLAAAVAAAVLAWNHRRRFPLAAQALGMIALVATAAYLPVIPDPRYLTPVRPLLFVLAGGGTAMLCSALQRRSPARAASVAAEASS